MSVEAPELCPRCGRVGELPVRCDACGFTGCEICGCEGGDLYGGPSCCDAARAEHETTMERVTSELAGEARAANARGEAAWDRVMADSGDERAAAVAEYEARR